MLRISSNLLFDANAFDCTTSDIALLHLEKAISRLYVSVNHSNHTREVKITSCRVIFIYESLDTSFPLYVSPFVNSTSCTIRTNKKTVQLPDYWLLAIQREEAIRSTLLQGYIPYETK